MTSDLMLFCFIGLFTKHFIFDFVLQGPFQYLNKGTYGHPGGLYHSALQAYGTFVVLLFVVGGPLAMTLAALDGLVHYHIDWAKVKINTHFELRPDNSEKFWWLLGLDQYLHYMTYAGLMFAVM